MQTFTNNCTRRSYKQFQSSNRHSAVYQFFCQLTKLRPRRTFASRCTAERDICRIRRDRKRNFASYRRYQFEVSAKQTKEPVEMRCSDNRVQQLLDQPDLFARWQKNETEKQGTKGGGGGGGEREKGKGKKTRQRERERKVRSVEFTCYRRWQVAQHFRLFPRAVFRVIWPACLTDLIPEIGQ